MTPKDIRSVILAFEVAVNSASVPGVHLDHRSVNGALRLANKVIGEKQLDEWIHKCWVYLESASTVLGNESTKHTLRYEDLYLHAHEFMSLACNARNRTALLELVRHKSSASLK